MSRVNVPKLLNNNIFVDFLNTYLNLPVFGQTPIYILKDKSWELHPELPSNLIEHMSGFLKWLEDHRLQHFLKTDLYLHFILCQLLLGMTLPALAAPKYESMPQESSESLETMQFSEDSVSSDSISSNSQESSIQLGHEAAKVEKAQPSETWDQWLLKRCIGSVQGMRRFRSFLMGTTGAELAEFWVRVEKMLKLNEIDVNQRDQYFAQLRTLQATHLQDGSVVMSTCGGFTDISSSNAMKLYRTRRDFIVKLQTGVLEKLKGYWLPRFLMHCKRNLRKLNGYDVVRREYQEKMSHGKVTEDDSPNPISTTSMKRTEGISWPYYTKAHKRLLWKLPYCKTKHVKITTTPQPPTKERRSCGRTQPKATAPKPTPQTLPKQQEPVCPHQPSTWVCSSSPSRDKQMKSRQGEDTFLKRDCAIPLIKAPSMLQCQRFPEMPLQFRYLHWAFNADQLAGEPFASFLRMKKNVSHLSYLLLWHDMTNFLNVVLSVKDRAGYLLRKILGQKIIEVYLTENSNQYAKLQVETDQNLKTLLPSGQVIPWIFTAQKEICEILLETYDDFLDHEDMNFLNLAVGAKPNDPSSWTQCKNLPPRVADTEDLHIRRMARSMLLNQACTAIGDTDKLTDEEWMLLVSEDTTNLGSMKMVIKAAAEDMEIKNMTFEELALKHPRLAIEELSKSFHRYYKTLVLLGLLDEEVLRDHLYLKLNVKVMKVGKKIFTRPKIVPKKLTDVLTDTTGLHFFQRFLEAYDADFPLQFWQAVEHLQNLTTLNEKRLYVNWMTKHFFNQNIRPEELLHCNAPIIKQIMEAIENGTPVTMTMLLQAQSAVQKSMQNWFELYLKTYPVETKYRLDSTGILRSIHVLSEANRAWMELQKLIRMVMLFQKMIRNSPIRKLFESYLQDEIYNDEENLATFRVISTVPSLINTSVGRLSDFAEESEMAPVKKRIVCNRAILINYLVNDLHFCMEIQHYVRRSEAAIIMAQMGMHDDIYEGLLRAKGEMISRLFLQADTAPRLRVNISEYEKDRVIMGMRYGALEPSLFHNARMSVILPLLHFWRRFCIKNALKIFGRPTRQWRKEYVEPNYFKPSVEYRFTHINPLFPGEDVPILRFTLAKGIQMLIPVEHDAHSETAGSEASGQRNVTPSPANGSTFEGKALMTKQ
ncbi:regulator of G-protein signaling protein-like isoform X3 [Leucoraja erinacea]|uniref:regulator of G-protein signaling protein-like isoform X3 n=1 Tax=Leucoraja erinaceus TaxID=7782 RepID=UPI002458FDB8|nr:regulator of G-protein signaling protein-like isoform X3 [Leucoraja erinacea]